MKIYSILLILSITLAFFSGRIAFLLSDQAQVNNKEVIYIKSLLQEMQERVNPHYNIDLTQIYKNDSYLELISPKTIFQHSPNWTLNSESCVKVLMRQKLQGLTRKSDLWDSFRCHISSELPDDFFERHPYIHDNGFSYAYLYITQWRPFRLEKNWTKNHLHYFHLEELSSLNIDLPQHFRFLLSLSKTERLQLVTGTNYFLTDKYLIINNALLNFSAYPLKMVNQFFKRSDYQLVRPDDKERCYYQLDQLCVKKSKVNLLQRLSETSYLIFTAAIFTLLITVSNLYNRILKQNLEEERKKHALRVLTHELRTPIASLLLQIENINDEDSNIDYKTQEKLLRLESDIYRLKYLAEKSRGYLQSESDKFIQFNNIDIDSINDFINNIIEETITVFPDSKIIFTPEFDTSCRFDPYWVQICIRNLIENSVRYGKGPTTIETKLTKKQIKIAIIDQGKIHSNNLKSFLKSNPHSGQGMGIGLKIVQKTLKEMGGTLDLTPSPTTFTMSLPFEQIKEV